MISYEIRFNGVAFEVLRTRTFITLSPQTAVVAVCDTRELADEEIKFQLAMDDDKARDRAGR
jgi:hypothetical protein